MGKLSDDYVDILLDMAFSKAANGFPASYYVGLSSTLPTNIGGNITEPTGNGYARVEVVNSNAEWGPASARATSNINTITFPAATPSGWGTMTHFILMDSLTSGSMVGWGALTTPLSVGLGTIPTFDPGTLVINAPGT